MASSLPHILNLTFFIFIFILVILTLACPVTSNDATTNKSVAQQIINNSISPVARIASLSSSEDIAAVDDEHDGDNDNSSSDTSDDSFPLDDDDESTTGEEVDNEDHQNSSLKTTTESSAKDTSDEVAILEPSATSLESTIATKEQNNTFKREAEDQTNKKVAEDVVVVDEAVEDEDDFCQESYVDSAYFNGYDTILTRGDRLWYYYKEQHKISKAYDQRRFTQGDHIQGAFNISRTPRCGQLTFNTTSESSSLASSLDKIQNSSPAFSTLQNVGDCKEISKLQAMAVYFLHNKDRSRSYYNLDVRNLNGTQKRVRSRDLPWGMKQVGLLGGNLWPNGWESYQAFRPVAFLPSRMELIFIINHFNSHDHSGFDLVNGTTSEKSKFPSSTSSELPFHRYTALLTWNSLDTFSWNSSWRFRVLTHPLPVVYTGMFEMNGIVYAIGESRSLPHHKDKPQKRVGKIYRYYVTEDDGRDLRETDQTVDDFFGCPRKTKKNEKPSDQVNSALSVNSRTSETSSTLSSTFTKSTTTTTTTTSTSTTQKPLMGVDLENRYQEEPKNRLKASGVFLQSSPPADSSNHQIYPSSSVFLRNSKAKILPITGANASLNHLLTPLLPSPGSGTTGNPLPPPGVALRENDSILLTIFIGIVISACVATIVLAFLTITGRKKDHLPPRFEGARIERTIPKPTIIGLDYHPRKSSFASSSSLTAINQLMTRYDSLNSINAIYSQIGGKPAALGGGGHVFTGNHYTPSHHLQQQQQQQIEKSKKKKSKHSKQPTSNINGTYHTVDRLNTTNLGVGGGSGAPPPPPPLSKSNNLSSQSQLSPSTNPRHHQDASGVFSGQHFDAHFE